MTTQDNNEAASTLTALDAVHILRLALVQAECAIKGREHTGFITKALTATERIAPAASASQSSTPVPRVGGNTFDELLSIGGSMSNMLYNIAQGSFTLAEYADNARTLQKKWDAARSDLAHVARQRQEPIGQVVMTPSYSTYVKWADGVMPPSGTVLYAEPIATPSAAVAEGVDTALPEPVFTHESIHTRQKSFYYSADQMREHGAQQSEAGRREKQAEFDAIFDAFGIGSEARTSGVLMANIRHTLHFANLLHAVEREFFMVPGEPDEDFPDETPGEECLLNCWGSTVEQYIEQFRAALARRSAVPPAKEEGLTAGLLEAAAWVSRCQSQLLDKTYVATGLRALAQQAKGEQQ